MRILHVVARSHTRGAELAAIELSEELESLGHRNRVVALGLSHDGSRDALLPPMVARSGVGLDVLVLASWRLRRLLRRQPADIVMAHGGWAAQVTAVAVPRGGPLLIWQRILRFPPEVWKPLHRVWWRTTARRVDAAVALTVELEEELRRLGFPGPVWVIPNARRPERFEGIDRAVEGTALREAVGIAAEVPLIGFVGHLVDQKRPERAVDVLAEVRQAGTPAHLVIAGDGPLRSSVERRVRALGLQGHVTLLGHRTDVERVFGAIDLCVLTSEAEGIPGVVIEAQMAGCPVVSFPLGGVGEVVEDGVTGVVLPRSDTRLMAATVVDLLGDTARRLQMGKEARSRTPLFAASRTAVIYAEQLAELEAHRSGRGRRRDDGG